MIGRDGRHRTEAVAGLALAALTLLAVAAAPAAEPARVAVVVHLLGGPNDIFPPGAAALRGATLDILGALYGARGEVLADRALTESLVSRHVIRTSTALTPAFLDDLRRESGAATLLAVTVHVEGRRVATGARAIDIVSGRLCGIGVAEAEVAESAPTPGEAARSDWRAALTAALRDALPVRNAATDRPTLLILPAGAVAMDPQAARATTLCVLAEAVADGRWSVMEPALATGALTAAGRDPGRLDRAGRALLSERCGVDWAVVPETVSFGSATTSGTALPSGESPGWERRPTADLTMTLRLLDLRTGLVRASASLKIDGERSPGWFGAMTPFTELDQIRAAAAGLWERFEPILEEQAS